MRQHQGPRGPMDALSLLQEFTEERQKQRNSRHWHLQVLERKDVRMDYDITSHRLEMQVRRLSARYDLEKQYHLRTMYQAICLGKHFGPKLVFLVALSPWTM